MTFRAQPHPPTHPERRHHTQDRQRVVIIGAMWAALSLLALAVALLQPDDPAPAAALLPGSALQAVAPEALAASSVAAPPTTPASVDPGPRL